VRCLSRRLRLKESEKVFRSGSVERNCLSVSKLTRFPIQTFKHAPRLDWRREFVSGTNFIQIPDPTACGHANFETSWEGRGRAFLRFFTFSRTKRKPQLKCETEKRRDFPRVWTFVTRTFVSCARKRKTNTCTRVYGTRVARWALNVTAYSSRRPWPARVSSDIFKSGFFARQKRITRTVSCCYADYFTTRVRLLIGVHYVRDVFR